MGLALVTTEKANLNLSSALYRIQKKKFKKSSVSCKITISQQFLTVAVHAQKIKPYSHQQVVLDKRHAPSARLNENNNLKKWGVLCWLDTSVCQGKLSPCSQYQ